MVDLSEWASFWKTRSRVLLISHIKDVRGEREGEANEGREESAERMFQESREKFAFEVFCKAFVI